MGVLNMEYTNRDKRQLEIEKSAVARLGAIGLIGMTLLAGCSSMNNAQSKPEASDVVTKVQVNLSIPPSQPSVGDIVHKGEDWHFTYMARADGVEDYDSEGNLLATPDTSGANCDFFTSLEDEVTYTLEDGAKNTIAVAELDSTPQFIDVTLLCVAYYTIKNMPELNSPVKLFRTHGNGQLIGSVDYWGWYAPDQITQGLIFQREQIDSYPPANPALQLTEDSEP